MGFTDFVSENIGFAEAVVFSAAPKSGARFQWGGTFFALLLLILNRTGPHRSSMQTNLLVFFLFTSFPNFLFNIVRGSFGYWISFFAVSAHLFSPEDFPVSRFILFVITPDWIAKGLRGSSAGCIFCLTIGVFLVLTKLRIMTADDEFQFNYNCFWYFLCIVALILFTITLF
ncbi:cold-regulated 413 plasma membrane protein 4 [Morus notabilis]|uniref:cold-regulated 413 plasma membrane protein 4 n=1 Tax=Morus notabilis TaxID=981085 RepID=UPI000CED77CF|nr:cold-regulated 413 plasma membrane protein 4 [Morus notabilis]